MCHIHGAKNIYMGHQWNKTQVIIRMLMYNSPMTYIVNKGFISQKLDDKMVIFDGEKSTLYTFNVTASYIFKKLKLGWSAAQIVSNMEQKYAATKPRLKQDVQKIIKEFIKRKVLIRTRPKKK